MSTVKQNREDNTLRNSRGTHHVPDTSEVVMMVVTIIMTLAAWVDLVPPGEIAW
jgi:hypothetical protein